MKALSRAAVRLAHGPEHSRGGAAQILPTARQPISGGRRSQDSYRRTFERSSKWCPMTLDDDLSKLNPTDLERVVRWVEDRLINAITPLNVYLQLDGCLQQEMPGNLRADRTLQAAQVAVREVMAAVEEVRRMARMQPQMNADERR